PDSTRLGLGQGCQGTVVPDTETLYETHSWNSEPQNIESAGGGNDEVFLAFDIQYSKLDILRFSVF
ncbi:MAG: hypothetical protein KAS40_23960, partial [Desulfobacterales bacterium]|nr:hypothetical protein [Desulfobacterales bacterium]